MNSQQGYHMELCSMLCGSPDGRGVWGRMDTCICMAEFTIHLKLSQRCLLVSYTSLQNKKFKKEKKKKKKLLTQRDFQVPLVVKNAGDIKSDSIFLQEDPLEEGMATPQHSFLENPMDSRAWQGYGPWGWKESDTTEAT